MEFLFEFIFQQIKHVSFISKVLAFRSKTELIKPVYNVNVSLIQPAFLSLLFFY